MLRNVVGHKYCILHSYLGLDPRIYFGGAQAVANLFATTFYPGNASRMVTLSQALAM